MLKPNIHKQTRKSAQIIRNLEELIILNMSRHILQLKSSMNQNLDTISELAEIDEENRKQRKRALSSDTKHSKSSSPAMSRQRDLSETRSASKLRTKLKPIAQSPNFELESKMQELKVYSQLFEDIISQDSVYGLLLSNVKSKYDAFVASISNRLQNSNKNANNERIQNALSELNDLKSELKRRRLKYKECVKILMKNSRSSRAKEQKYQVLTQLLREQGYPVDEVFQSLPNIPPLKVSALPPHEDSGSSKSTGDS